MLNMALTPRQFQEPTDNPGPLHRLVHPHAPGGAGPRDAASAIASSRRVRLDGKFFRLGDEKFWVDGRLTLDELSEALGSDLEHDEVSTVGGLIYTELGRVPRPGEELRINGFRVVVEQVARRRIERVYFERLSNLVAADSSTEEL